MSMARLVSLISIGILWAAAFSPATRTADAAVTGPTFYVDSAGNEKDGLPGNGFCMTSTFKCTLRAAIEEANSNPDLNRIFFDLPGVGIHAIPVLNGPLPEITSPVEINGLTQPDCSAPCIVLDGSALIGAPNGLYLHTNGSKLKGLAIHSFAGAGIRTLGNGNYILGSYVGVIPGDDLAHPNGMGIILSGSNNTIGGTSVTAHNLISGNSFNGILVGSEPGVTHSGNKIRGNYIGTSVDGTQDLGNGANGIQVGSQAVGTLIGGATSVSGNVISGNNFFGILIQGDDTIVQGNYIGTGPGGTGVVGNSNYGIRVDTIATDTLIGGENNGEGNVIQRNGSDGVSVATTGAADTTIWRNRIYANHDLGIDLSPNGVTLNDPLDADTGANGLQNYPVVVSADSATRVINIRLYSKASKTYVIELFSVPAGKCDASHRGEGRTFLGHFSVTTDAAGYGHTSFTSAVSFAAGVEVTATATDPGGRTSEFSMCTTAD